MLSGQCLDAGVRHCTHHIGLQASGFGAGRDGHLKGSRKTTYDTATYNLVGLHALSQTPTNSRLSPSIEHNPASLAHKDVAWPHRLLYEPPLQRARALAPLWDDYCTPVRAHHLDLHVVLVGFADRAVLGIIGGLRVGCFYVGMLLSRELWPFRPRHIFWDKLALHTTE